MVDDPYQLFPGHDDIDLELLIEALEAECEGEDELPWRTAFPRPGVRDQLRSLGKRIRRPVL